MSTKQTRKYLSGELNTHEKLPIDHKTNDSFVSVAMAIVVIN